MFDWLFEGRLTGYLFLAVVVLILLGLWTRDRRRGWLFAAGFVVLLIGVYFLLDRLVETRSEQIGRKLKDMAAGVKAKDAGRIFQHISEDFSFGGFNKATFRRSVETILERNWVDDLEVWDFRFPDDRGKVEFQAKPKGRLPGTDAFYLVRAEFKREADGQWRLKTYQVFNPYVDSNKPIDIPQLPR